MRRVGVLLSGCGVYDGSDVQETVLLTLALRRRGLRAFFLSPETEQSAVVDHTTGEVVEGAEPRKLMQESARLARGAIEPLSDTAASQLDALVIPGGMGAVRNLCLPGPGLLGVGGVRPEVAALLDTLAARSVPLAAIGLGRVVLDRHRDSPLRESALGVAVTGVEEEEGGLLFTPGFMAGESVADVAQGIEAMVEVLARRMGILLPANDRRGKG